MNAPIDWRSLPLGEGGRSLIEASAGTGKTWTISVLYLRLILEFALSPRQIVVTTFATAAAQELRERLRARLLWAELQASTQQSGDEDVQAVDAHWLHARWRNDTKLHEQDLARIRLAISELDIAPISTLHGLCRSIVADHPFACGSAFNRGDLIGSDALVNELAGDLIRHLQQGDADSELVRLQQGYQCEFSRATLTRQLHLCLMPDAIVPCIDMAQIEKALPNAWANRLRTVVARDELFTKSCALRTHWSALADVIDDPMRPLPTRHLDRALANAAKLNGIAAKGKSDPELLAAVAFSLSCVSILEPLRDRPAQAFWNAAAQWARAEARNRLQNRNQHTFDDLLLSVHDSLDRDRQSRNGPGLAEALYRAWPVALIDEFQDTDGIQYGILDRIFRDVDGAARGRLVMIGDPKQAIYRFRGGDIHAYLRAARTVTPDSRMSLNVNHRSSANLVAACNAFYAMAGDVLGSDDDETPDALAIRYQPVLASERQNATPYCVNGLPVAQPLCLHYLCDVPESAEQRKALALRVCANQIAQMLQSGEHVIAGRALQPSDIAVLLPSNQQVESLRELLSERAVPCISTIRSSVFTGDTACDLHLLLYGIAHCDEKAALRAAAATRLWGCSLAQLRSWDDDPAPEQAIAQQFHEWLLLWRAEGVYVVISALIAQLAPRVLHTSRGERVLTDLRHLAELLQAQSELAPGIEALLAWLGQQQRADGDADEEAADAQQLRIESDQRRVRLMSLHASKGLEFSIVFLPLMWAHGEHRESGLSLLSDPDGGPRRIDSSEKGKTLQSAELFDERFRLLYVALTRAIHACHVFVLPPDRLAQANAKGPASGSARSAIDVMLARMQPPLDSPGRDDAAGTFEWRDGWQPQSMRVLHEPNTGPATRHSARELPPAVSHSLSAKHSFTTLSRGGGQRSADAETAAADEADARQQLPLSLLNQAQPQQSLPHPELLGLAAIRGKAIGNAIHSIFEHRVIGVPLITQKPLLRHWLTAHAVALGELPAEMVVERLARRLQAALDAPLGAAQAPQLCLSALPENALRAEMEFYFPLAGASMHTLARVCAAHGEAGLAPVDARTLVGLMNGKIDLIFQHQGRYYLLDYKGNMLGEGLPAYQGAALHTAMDAAHYRFQALLYSVALDRYLHQRLGNSYQRSQHLGECFYLFVRAAGLGVDSGIWRHRFSDPLLDAVNAVFAGHVADSELA
ncbi:MAG: UvrD-helicase domain-containing protein [Xanthomonadales bacterium]|nr:UvrD-helicase domain-containing protein [Xanthomonadales bacterium]MDZ4117495.1 UvrD-helicase domain-containing protein [Xanthomonadaceae bacterium]MDZ4379433.1 UvrD-helicase domain-containing protein [Xanthomonadaceae bacterium]